MQKYTLIHELEDIKFSVIVCVHGQISRRRCSRSAWNFARWQSCVPDRSSPLLVPISLGVSKGGLQGVKCYWTICLRRNVVAFCQDSPMRGTATFVVSGRRSTHTCYGAITYSGPSKCWWHATVQQWSMPKPDSRWESRFFHTSPAFDAR